MGHAAMEFMAMGSYLPFIPTIILGTLLESWNRKINDVNVLCT